MGESSIGVVEVKKPGNGGALQNPYVQGQIFDYMLRLKSFFGLEHVFGILSSYKEWRIYWLPSSNVAAGAMTIPVPGQEKKAKTVVPPRLLHGSRIFVWHDKALLRVLCTTILKMYHSLRSPVQLS